MVAYFFFGSEEMSQKARQCGVYDYNFCHTSINLVFVILLAVGLLVHLRMSRILK
jgi:hypothetical protein